ncbi:MAG: AsmA family protein [Verrucomicrobiota bacterium]
MKTLLRIFALLCIFIILLLAGAYFYLTNAGVQKRIVEGQLPEGSSIEHIKIGLGSIELSGLILSLENGTELELGDLQSSFEPLDAFFAKTIKLGDLSLTDVRVQLPSVSEATVPATSISSGNPGPQPKPPASSTIASTADEEKEPLSFDQIYTLGEIEWLFDFGTINLDGEIIDGKGSSYKLVVNSDAIRPGQQSTVNVAVDSVFSEPLQSGLSSLSGELVFQLTQAQSGGFEDFKIVAKAVAKDEAGGRLLYSDQTIDTSIDSAGRKVKLSFTTETDVPNPGVFAPELSEVGPVSLDGEGEAMIEGDSLRLSKAALAAKANGSEVIDMQLKQEMTLGGKQNLVGDLLDLKITRMPTIWLRPFLANDVEYDSDVFSTQLSVSGEPDGALVVNFGQPLSLKNLSLSSGGEGVISNLDLSLLPFFKIHSDDSVEFAINEIKLSDNYGAFLEGGLSGRIQPDVDRQSNPIAGIELDAKLDLGLQPLLQQPALVGKTSVMSGSVVYDLSLDPKADFPVTIQGRLTGLRTRANPGSTKDYQFAAQLKPGGGEFWSVDSSLVAGRPEQASTDLRISGSLQPGTEPLKFNLDLKGPLVSQDDLDYLIGAFTATDQESAQSKTKYRSNVPTVPPSTPVQTQPLPAENPPWSMLDGTASLDIGSFQLSSGKSIENLKSSAIISGPLLKVDQSSASIEGGQFDGSMEIRFNEDLARPYIMAADFNISEVDPAVFASSSGKASPVQGLFNGELSLKGAGVTLEESFDTALLELDLNGRDGVVTAFEIDNRSALGLGIVGILGQQFDRPGVTALTNTIPYFKDIRFNNFDLKVSRGEDQRMLIPKMSFEGDSLLISGSGVVAASSLTELADQPLNMSLELGAKGRLTEYLDMLQLLQPTEGEDGFRRWVRDINIGGTLSSPNTDELSALLRQAAQVAFKKPAPQKTEPQTGETGSAQSGRSELNESPASSAGQTEEEEIDEVDIALELLESFF